VEPKLIAAALVLAGLWGGIVPSAQAGIIWYRSRAEWTAAAGPPTFTEDFEGFTSDVGFRTSTLQLEE
jgi:hypothetical protein